MEFVAIDFETANVSRDSICSIGLVTVRDGIIVDEYYRLVRPDPLYFDPYNVAIHGITKEMVKNEPRFCDLWPEILSKLQNKQVIAHYAQFDMSVLRCTLNYYNIAFPCFDYLCTWVLSKKALPGLLSYKLNYVASHIAFHFVHHNALEDAKACAAIFSHILQSNSSADFLALASKFSINCGRMEGDSYTPCGSKRSITNTNAYMSRIKPNSDNIDSTHYFYSKHIAFTGTLLSMPRKQAVQDIVNKGAVFSPSVTKATNILVCGYQTPSKFAENAKSSAKFLKAQKLLSEGQDIEIMNEDDFVKILQS